MTSGVIYTIAGVAEIAFAISTKLCTAEVKAYSIASWRYHGNG